MEERRRAELLLEARGLSEGLAEHCRGTARQAEDLARRWGASPDAAATAGLLHDLCRELPRQEVLDLARKHGLEIDPIEEEYAVQLLHARLAVARHTLGGPGMSVLDDCVFVADATEPGRTWKGVDDVRRLARESLDAAVVSLAERDLARLRARGRAPHPLMVALLEERHAGR
jgi:HD superfamily phosphohydrolase YqeK